jgi:hypothetical protein
VHNGISARELGAEVPLVTAPNGRGQKVVVCTPGGEPALVINYPGFSITDNKITSPGMCGDGY